MCFGVFLTTLIQDPHKVFRSDGTPAGPPICRVESAGTTSEIFLKTVKREIRNINDLRLEWRIWFLMPMFFGANFL